MRLTSIDYVYVLLSIIAGLWQAWCLNYGSDDVVAVLVALIGLPFALLTYAHESLSPSAKAHAERPTWKQVLVLAVGMPLCILVSSLTILVETGIMQLSGFGIDNLPFYDLRLLIGEAAACFLWTYCLMMWSRRARFGHSRMRMSVLFGALLTAVLLAFGLSKLMLRTFHRDLFFVLTSLIATAASALILIFLRKLRDREKTYDSLNRAAGALNH